MTYRSLRDFISKLEAEGELVRVREPVSTVLEMTEIQTRLLAEGEEEEAGKVAGAVGATLALAVAVLCLAGVLATPWLIDIIAPGFSGSKRDLTISLVRILFPGAGLLVFSAWCLGILNSHRKLFLSYAAPVMWSAAMIATLWIFGGRSTLSQLAITLAWGSVAGSALQFGIQLPMVLKLARHLRLRLKLLRQKHRPPKCRSRKLPPVRSSPRPLPSLRPRRLPLPGCHSRPSCRSFVAGARARNFRSKTATTW